MKNKELADLLFDKMTEYLVTAPAGKVLMRVSSAAGKSPRELLPAFVDIMADRMNIVQVNYVNKVVGEIYDLTKGDEFDPEILFRNALRLDKAVALGGDIVVHGKEDRKGYLIRDMAMHQEY